MQRIDDFEKRKTVEVGIPSADPSDSMLAHENRGMRVVEEIARQVRKLRDNLRGDIRMPGPLHRRRILRSGAPGKA